MRRLVGAVAVLGMLALAGCGGGEPLPTLPPTPTATPVFASEEEALAAAEEAYVAYLEMSNLISNEGGIDPERIAPFAVRELLVAAMQGFGTLQANSWRTTGQSALARSQLQYANLDGIDGEDVVAAYFCVDFSGVDVLNAEGVSVVSPDRPELQAFEVFFDLVDAELRASSLTAWDPQVCEV